MTSVVFSLCCVLLCVGSYIFRSGLQLKKNAGWFRVEQVNFFSGMDRAWTRYIVIGLESGWVTRIFKRVGTGKNKKKARAYFNLLPPKQYG